MKPDDTEEETKSCYHPNLSNQYLYKPNVKLPDLDETGETVADIELPNTRAGLDRRIEQCMEMTMEAFPCFDFQYPSTALSRKPDFEDPYATFWANQNAQGRRAGLYVHIPFCRSKCSFCYFTVAANRGEDEVDRYLDTLENEIRHVAPTVRDRVIESVYVGGGTPTYLTTSQLDRLFALLYRHFDLSAFTEWSIESTPTLANPEKLRVMKQHGVTRLSLGVQTTHDHLLKKLNRSFERKDIERIVEQARSAGIDNINLDFMYALPGQTVDDWFRTLDDAFAQDIPGITIYSLDLHESTHFFRIKDKLELAGLETQLRMYDEAVERLYRHGYRKINSSIFARDKSCYTQQNRRWENLPLIALGPGAQSYSPGFAFRNIGDLGRYAEAVNTGRTVVDKYAVLEPGEEFYREAVSMIRFAMLDKVGFAQRYGQSIDSRFRYLIETLIRLGYLEETADSVHLTRDGLHRSNMISMFFYSDPIKQKLVDHLYTMHAPQMRALRSVGLTEDGNLQ
jgi:oxygen-independent coproporphyrinogen-3 oxidase